MQLSAMNLDGDIINLLYKKSLVSLAYAQPIQATLISDCKDYFFGIAHPKHLDLISFLGRSLLLAGDWPQTTMSREKAYNF